MSRTSSSSGRCVCVGVIYDIILNFHQNMMNQIFYSSTDLWNNNVSLLFTGRKHLAVF